jgi:hypothetical protein
MKKLITVGLAAACFMAFTIPAYGLVATDMIGDNDGFGFGVPDGADVPATLFDNRSAAEMAAINGAQATDLADNFDVTFTHSFDATQFATLTAAWFTIDIQGLQQGVFGGLSHLYMDGTEVMSFQTIDQGAFGSGIFNYAVNLADLADGALNVYFDNYTVYDQFGNLTNSDYISIDFTQLTVEGTPVPEPATMALFGLGLAGMGIIRRLRK